MRLRESVCIPAIILVCAAGLACAKTYEVGDAKEYSSIGAVPWESLAAGDTVLIHYRPEAYREKFVIGVAGTKDAPITVRGVPGPNGQLPVIDARDAVTRPGLRYSNEYRSIIQLGGLFSENARTPSNIVIENLEVRSCRAPYTFTDSAGKKQPYREDSGPVRFMACDGVVLRNCAIRDGGMGTISSANTRNITIENCYYVDNGMESPEGAYVHQSYTETLGMLYQYNHFSHLRKDCTGTNLKDRSAGNVIRYNWIEGGNKQIDLPDLYDTGTARIEAAKRGDASAVNDFIDFDYRYRATFIYGNVLIEPEGDGNPEMITYGGDMGEPRYYRKGTLYFYNNTVISKRTDTTSIFKLKTNDETCDARNNIFYTTAPGKTLAITMWNGSVYLSHNWIRSGWVASHQGADFAGELNDDGTNIAGESPGFADEAGQDYHLAPGSACIDAGRNIPPRALPDNDVTSQYVKHQSGRPRPRDGKIDIGAYEYAGAAAPK